MAQTGVVAWSQTAASNATADSNINWAEGMPPAAVNDSSRAEMASVAKWRDDISGLLSAGGTSTAYTITSNQTFSTLGYLNGQRLCFSVNTTNGAAATLNVDSLGAKALQIDSSTALPAGALKEGGRYDVSYNSSGGYFLVHGQPNAIATGAITASTVSASGLITGSALSTAGSITAASIVTSGAAFFTGTVTAGGSLNVTSGFAVAGGSVTLPAGSVANAALAAPGGLVRLFSTSTAGAAMSFTSTQGFTTTYRSYKFYIDNLRPATDNTDLLFQLSTTGGATWNTSTYVAAIHVADSIEANAAAAFTTGVPAGYHISNTSGNYSGVVEILNPTGARAWVITNGSSLASGDIIVRRSSGGGTAIGMTPINAVRFIMSSGNITSAKITMYGLTDS